MQASVHSVAFSEANGLIASGSKDRTVRLWLPTACVPAAAGGCVSASRLQCADLCMLRLPAVRAAPRC